MKTIENTLPRSASVTLTPITTGASSGLFEFEAPNKEAAEDVCRAVEAVLNKDAKDAQLKHATFVVDVQPAGPDFVADREAVLARNRWHQMSQPALAIPAQNTQTIVRVCEIDHVRPATDVRPGPESTEEQVSVSVKARSKYGRERKHSFYGDLAPRAKGWHFAHDLNELTADKSQGNLHWKMAVVYLDGNGFGKLQNALCATPDIQRQFDKTLKNYRADALDTLLKAMSEGDGWASSQGRYHLETLLWGGDELIWVVPAWQGWKTLWLFYQQSRKWNFEGHPLTHAGGIVFCHHNAPIHRITALAKGLAEIAKEKAGQRTSLLTLFLSPSIMWDVTWESFFKTATTAVVRM